MTTRAYEIKLTGLRAWGHHGVLAEERRDGQEFVVDVELTLERVRVDDVALTVDYAALAAELVASVARDPVDLIETLADRLAGVCLVDPLVRFAQVTVHKPQAPVGHPFGDVSATVTRWPGLNDAVLSLGSNLGESLATLQRAVDRLARIEGVTLTGVSPVYRTAPWGGVEQDDYVNIVVGAVLADGLGSDDLLAETQRIEADLGRTRDVRWGPRTLDIDLITVKNDEFTSDELTLPHPRAQERAFVLVPWLELDPRAFLPGHGRVRDLLAGLDTSGVHRLDDVRIEVP